MAEIDRPPKSGSVPRAPKRVHGRGWLQKRARNGRSWRLRKMTSPRYCVGTKTGGR